VAPLLLLPVLSVVAPLLLLPVLPVPVLLPVDGGATGQAGWHMPGLPPPPPQAFSSRTKPSTAASRAP